MYITRQLRDRRGYVRELVPHRSDLFRFLEGPGLSVLHGPLSLRVLDGFSAGFTRFVGWVHALGLTYLGLGALRVGRVL